MRPAQWAQVWGRLRGRAAQLDPGVAPAWHAALDRFRPEQVLEAIAQLPQGQVDFDTLMAILDPPPPPAIPEAFGQAKRWAEEATKVRKLDEPAPERPQHLAVVVAAAGAGLEWLRDVDPDDSAVHQKWRDVYGEVVRRARR